MRKPVLTLGSLLVALSLGVQANPVKRAAFLVELEKIKPIGASTSPVPKDGVMQWARERNRIVASDAASVTAMLAQNGRVADELLSSPHEPKQRQGLRLAQYTAQLASEKLRDKTIAAKFYEVFVLPHIGVAYQERWQDLSRQRLLEEALYAFEVAKDSARVEMTLRWLLKEPLNSNSRDWTRGELAQVLAARGEYAEAITHLKAINSRSIVKVKKLIPLYEKKLAAQKASTKS